MNSSTVFELILLASAAYYCAVQIGLLIGLLRLKYPLQHDQPFVSAIVAARNEEKTIGGLLEVLLQQTYPNYEIIVVNDRSTDSTEAIVREYQKRNKKIRLLTIQSLLGDMPAKKNALAAGIRSSKGEILCFTDADCLPGRHWLEKLVACFDLNTGVVAGYSPYDVGLLSAESLHGHSRTILFRFIEGEEFKGAIWSAGSIGLNLAWLCTGRSLAYRREVFDEVGGFEKIKMSLSGDDDLFLQLVRRNTAWKIRYCTTPASFVRTAPPPDFDAFVNQRTRHFSSGKFFTLPMKVFFSLFHLSNLILLAGLIVAPWSPTHWAIGVVGFVIKMLFDLLVFITAQKVLETEAFTRGSRLLNFLLTEFLYVLYNTFIGPLGFIRSFRWKDNVTTQATHPTILSNDRS